MSAEEAHRIVTALVNAANEQATRAEASEREVKAIADVLASLVRHQQAEMLEIRGHLAASHADMGKTMAAINLVLQATIDAAGGRFLAFQRDYEGLMEQVNFKLQEHERVIIETSNKGVEQYKELGQEIQKMRGQAGLQASGPAASAGQPMHYNVSSPIPAQAMPPAALLLQ